MDFPDALALAKTGAIIRRSGWNGKGMWVTVLTEVQPRELYGQFYETYPYLVMKAADGKLVIGWLASQTDLLSDDWELVELAS